MKIKSTFIASVSTLLLASGYSQLNNAYTAADFASIPPFITDSADPFVMINLSVELTQQAEAYTDGPQVYGSTACPGRAAGVGICYTNAEQYLGYFDSEKCYKYINSAGGDFSVTSTAYQTAGAFQTALGPNLTTNQTTDYFKPIGAATNRQCSGNQFSGNFMNWATMTALDEFRSAMVGGARIVDTAGANAQTLLTRTHRTSWSFVNKSISTTAVSGFSTNASSVTPFVNGAIAAGNTFVGDTLTVVNDWNGNNGNRVRFLNEAGAIIAEFSVVVEVCDSSVGIEANCAAYTDGTNTWYKPEGVMQNNSLNMRFALTSYSAQSGNTRNGGVLRANAKYIAALMPSATGGVVSNPNAETNASGQHVFDPDCMLSEHITGCSLTSTSNGTGGVQNSGIINYINSFGLNGYKGNDPVAELYYEGLRYFMGLSPTSEYFNASGTLPALTDAQKDNFPVITTWDDPILDQCQPNYMVAIGDQFSWGDNSLPGASVNGSGIPTNVSNEAEALALGIDVDDLTNMVGTLEGYFPGSLGLQTRGRDKNGWYVAGLAYYANTQDIRPEAGMPGIQNVKTFFIDTQEFNGSPPQRERNPLWMAAKYGGFEETDPASTSTGNPDPNNGDTPTLNLALTSPVTDTQRTNCSSNDEWDADGDCEPDTYTLASQPANLIRGLNNAFNDIASNINAGSAAAVSTNSSSGEGTVIQGLFKPSHTEGSRKIEWLGIVQSLFIDEFGNFREDTNNDQTISDADRLIAFTFNAAENKSEAQLFDASSYNSGETFAARPSSDTPIDTVEIEDLNAIWNARNELAKLDNTTIHTNRTYSALADTGRYIFSSLDSDNDGLTSSSDVMPFVSASFAAGENFRYLGLDSTTSTGAANIVDFIRGKEEITGFRSRTINYDDTNGNDTNGVPIEEVWRLGDVVSSSPTIVGRPDTRYDIIYNDRTYAQFREQYFDRRNVVYVGANDGMLHAFNAGFYDATTQTVDTSKNGAVAHPLGSELWAYVPYNVLPHLQWLTSTEYPHVYYVDGIPQVFDVNIFDSSDPKYPGGWGTILVVGMRFGGGDFTFDPDDDAIDADTSDDVTTRSSYVILDITDPESPPTLLAEITHPEMGYTTSRPTLIKKRKANSADGTFVSPDANNWYLVFGSGPYGSDDANRTLALTDAVSDQAGKLFVYDLKDKAFEVDGVTSNDYFELTTAAANGFIGDLSVADWDQDYTDDVVYFGTVRGSVNAPSGDLMRMNLSDAFSSVDPSFSVSSAPTLFTQLLSDTGTDSANDPFTGPPRVAISAQGDYWVYAGSGRFFIADDGLSAPQHRYVGIKEPVSGGALTFDTVAVNAFGPGLDLVNTTNVEVFSDGGLRDRASPTNDFVTLDNGNTVRTFSALRAEIGDEQGWYFDFNTAPARNVGQSELFSSNVLFTEYIPTNDRCDPLGETFLNAVNFATGTPTVGAVSGDFPPNASDTNAGGGELLTGRAEFSIGLVRDVVIDENGRVIGQGALGGLANLSPPVTPAATGRMSWREIPIDW